MTRSSITALGIGQCVNWGVLYYAFAVLIGPLERELALDTWVVTGAFSLGLLTCALLAPTIGKWGDRGAAPALIQTGGVAAAALLFLWAAAPASVVTLYAIWAALGCCMAATLYEPVFLIVTRAYDDRAKRLRVLAAVTVFGGLASTVFLPLTAFLVASMGWRGAVATLGALVLISTAATYLIVFRHTAEAGAAVPPESVPTRGGSAPSHFRLVSAAFALASLAGAAFTANLVPALGERGIGAAKAALLGGVIGLMQIPGRALLMRGGVDTSPSRLLAISLALQAGGFGVIATATSIVAVTAGTMLFALGAGLTSLVRPHLVAASFGAARSGYLNGRIAGRQQLARAAGPVAVAWLAGFASYSAVFIVFAGLFALGIIVVNGADRRMRRLSFEEEVV